MKILRNLDPTLRTVCFSYSYEGLRPKEMVRIKKELKIIDAMGFRYRGG
jgi:hypothetical protein